MFRGTQSRSQHLFFGDFDPPISLSRWDWFLQSSRTRILDWNFSFRVFKNKPPNSVESCSPRTYTPFTPKPWHVLKLFVCLPVFLFFRVKEYLNPLENWFFSIVFFWFSLKARHSWFPGFLRQLFYWRRSGFKQNKKSVMRMIDTSAHKFYAWYIWRHFNWLHTKVLDNSSRQ